MEGYLHKEMVGDAEGGGRGDLLMKIRDSVWKKCVQCGSRLEELQNEAYGCDLCQKPINLYDADKDRNYLMLTVFFNGNKEAVHKHYCSWVCCLKELRKIKTDYFVSLPYLHYDEKAVGMKAADFLKCIKSNLGD